MGWGVHAVTFSGALCVPFGCGKRTTTCTTADFPEDPRVRGCRKSLPGEELSRSHGRLSQLLGDSVESDRFKFRDPEIPDTCQNRVEGSEPAESDGRAPAHCAHCAHVRRDSTETLSSPGPTAPIGAASPRPCARGHQETPSLRTMPALGLSLQNRPVTSPHEARPPPTSSTRASDADPSLEVLGARRRRDAQFVPPAQSRDAGLGCFSQRPARPRRPLLISRILSPACVFCPVSRVWGPSEGQCGLPLTSL